ncbi:Response regulator receiver domain-containing protein [Nocardia amikacinitolerans]|uniref:Response regulator receiver domain-containing protein n=1 Tax=Nocardia amikacinitolerans TaxID=756689 RepID=A0A285LW21_9NOCA|nr:response regulator [Nocardia amikacinitolerans]SNY88337.1 Response regulator receiver domain-containing protein [Nocardia amikacinitolerans]
MNETIDAVAGLLWPLLAAAALCMFRGPLARVISSAARRQFTLRIGGQELDMKQVSEQQESMIEDLQTQVRRLREQVDQLTAERALGTGSARVGAPGGDTRSSAATDVGNSLDLGPAFGATPPPHPLPESPAASAILWVDDHPSNNAFLIDRLERNGIRVDTALTTAAATDLLSTRRYAVILTDMNRTENGTAVPDAGLRLTETVRARGLTTPILVFTSAHTACGDNSDRALAAGARTVTSSPTDLTGELATLGLLPR